MISIPTAPILTDELIRKCVHFCLCLFVLILFRYGVSVVITVITGGVIFYTTIELLLLKKVPLPFINHLMYQVSRRQKPIPVGPYTFAIGIIATVIIFPVQIAIIAILCLAFGDVIASLVGISVGDHPLPLGYKTWEGSIACFLSIFLPLSIYTSSFFIGIIGALTAALCEAIPIRDGDNILIPLGTGGLLLLLYLGGYS